MTGTKLEIYRVDEGDPILPPSEEELARDTGLAQRWADAQEELREYLAPGCDIIVCKHRTRGMIAILSTPPGFLNIENVSLPLIQYFTTGKFCGSKYQYDVELDCDGTVAKKRGGDKDLTETQMVWLRELFLSQRKLTESGEGNF